MKKSLVLSLVVILSLSALATAAEMRVLAGQVGYEAAGPKRAVVLGAKGALDAEATRADFPRIADWRALISGSTGSRSKLRFRLRCLTCGPGSSC